MPTGTLTKISNFVKKYYCEILFIVAFLLAFYVRAISIVPGRILSYDPVYQYRFTKYFVDWGFLPEWDELSYYVGRPVEPMGLMYYLTAILYTIFKAFNKGISLITTCAWASAIYGAVMVIPAYFLGKELKDKRAGVLAAFFIGLCPQILSRTFGSSYDTDQLVLFFILLTLYLYIRLFRNPCVYTFTMALMGTVAFMLTWPMAWYTYFIYLGIVFAYLYFDYALKAFEKRKESVEPLFKAVLPLFFLFLCLLRGVFVLIGIIFSAAWIIYLSFGYSREKTVRALIPPALLFVFSIIFAEFLKIKAIEHLVDLFTFAISPQVWIVNESIAELQPVFGLTSIIYSFGRLITTNIVIDALVLLLLICAFVYSFIKPLREKNTEAISIFLALASIAFITSMRGIRFTEFSSAIFLVLCSAGLIMLYDFLSQREFSGKIFKGVIVFVILLTISLGIQLAHFLGPDIDKNWDETWKYLREKTPELSLVGTWWDPGHMITGYAERRVIADGAHCGRDCLYNINIRIMDLGRIFMAKSEEEALKILEKYKGTSPKVYWIASKDLIGKFQWIQFYGSGCDARKEPRKCELYYYLPQRNVLYTDEGKPFLYIYAGNIRVLSAGVAYPIPFYTEGYNAMLIKEVWFYNGSKIIRIDFTKYNLTDVVNTLKPIFRQLGYRLSYRYLPYALWISENRGYAVLIPQRLKDVLFTKLFFLDGEGLKHFKLVLKNPEVRLYEVTGL